MIDFNDPVIRDQVERYIGDPERCMPSERARWEAAGFVAKGCNCPHDRCIAEEMNDCFQGSSAKCPRHP